MIWMAWPMPSSRFWKTTRAAPGLAAARRRPSSEWDAACMGERIEAVYADVIRERVRHRVPETREAASP